ncbi:hypothetical protein [Sulfurimonas indica]|uniref:hypothetical protein n=1 Tax=Sulfurimonas TaxID=202746 RepID=UPI0012645EB9|nr:hypothetical protein [Sulfurimonas indica]
MKKIAILLVSFCASLFAIQQPVFLGTEGKVFKPAEKDMYLVLKEKFRNFEKDNNLTKKFKEILKNKMYVDMNVKTCEQDKIYNKKIIYIVKENVVFQGKTIAKKGDEINLLEKVRLDGLAIFTNYTTEKEKNILMTIINQYETRLRIYVTKGDINRLKNDIAHFFPKRNNIIVGKAPKILLKRFNVQCVPSVMYQKNYELITTEIGVQKDE